MPLKFLPREVRKNKGEKGGRQDSAIKSERINRAGERASEQARSRTYASMRSQFISGRPKRGLTFLPSSTAERLVVIVIIVVVLVVVDVSKGYE